MNEKEKMAEEKARRVAEALKPEPKNPTTAVKIEEKSVKEKLIEFLEKEKLPYKYDERTGIFEVRFPHSAREIYINLRAHAELPTSTGGDILEVGELRDGTYRLAGQYAPAQFIAFINKIKTFHKSI